MAKVAKSAEAKSVINSGVRTILSKRYPHPPPVVSTVVQVFECEECEEFEELEEAGLTGVARVAVRQIFRALRASADTA